MMSPTSHDPKDLIQKFLEAEFEKRNVEARWSEPYQLSDDLWKVFIAIIGIPDLMERVNILQSIEDRWNNDENRPFDLTTLPARIIDGVLTAPANA